MNRATILFFIIFSLACSCQQPCKNKKNVIETPINSPKNIILMIGDGMGVTQLTAGIIKNDEVLNILRCQYVGLSNTSSLDNLITDSGAGGTAISTGKKTNNGHIAVDHNNNPLLTMLELAEKNNLATGLVSTSAITHATPASFIAHQNNRYNYEAIALDFLNTDIDLIIGGGLEHFKNRKDKLNLIDSLIKNDYEIIDNLNDLANLKKQKAACFLADNHLPKVSEGRNNYLEKATEHAINHLSKNKNGFFLMIEGSQIDWGGHDNDIEYVVSEVIDFDKAVGKAFDFAEIDNKTLVIVTADHETGGLTIIDGEIKDRSISTHFSTDHHTPSLVPVCSFGNGASRFSGIYENTEIFHKMKESFMFQE